MFCSNLFYLCILTTAYVIVNAIYSVVAAATTTVAAATTATITGTVRCIGCSAACISCWAVWILVGNGQSGTAFYVCWTWYCAKNMKKKDAIISKSRMSACVWANTEILINGCIVRKASRCKWKYFYRTFPHNINVLLVISEDVCVYFNHNIVLYPCILLYFVDVIMYNEKCGGCLKYNSKRKMKVPICS